MKIWEYQSKNLKNKGNRRKNYRKFQTTRGSINWTKMGQRYSCKNKKKDFKVSISIESTKALKNFKKKTVILDQAGVKEIFYDKNDIFGLLDENTINWSLYKFTCIETQKNYEIIKLLQQE